MVTAVLKLYFIGTALSVLAVLFALADSFGGLMYVQDDHYTLDLDQQTKTRGPVPSRGRHRRSQRRTSVTKHIGS